MSFMISKESDNIQSITEIEDAFSAIAADGEHPYVTREELSQVRLHSLLHRMLLCAIVSIGAVTRTV